MEKERKEAPLKSQPNISTKNPPLQHAKGDPKLTMDVI